MIRRLILVVYCILAVHPQCLQAQSYSSVHYDTKDGLPSATVYDISQDKNGFVWFATEGGLCRFDGKNFKTFTTKDGLPDNSILKVHGDNTGRVYFTPFTHGLYYYQNDSFTKIPIPDKHKIDLSTITALVNKKDKILLSGLINSYILENNRIVSFHEKYNEIPDPVFLKGSYDSLVIVSNNLRLYFVPDSGSIRTDLLKDKWPHLVFFDEETRKRAVPNQTRGRNFLDGRLRGGSRVYMLVEDHLLVFDTSGSNWLYKIAVEKFSKAFMDNENNLWVATLGNGAYRFPSFGFKSISFDGKSEIFSLVKSGDQLIAGTDYSKMYSLPVNTAGPGYAVADFSRFLNFTTNAVSLATSRNRIYVLRSDRENLYIGTDAFLLRRTGHTAPIFKKIHPIKDIDVAGNKILVCTGYNVLLLDEKDLSVRDTLLEQRSTCGIRYQGAYYIGTLGGLIAIDSSTKKITELYNQVPAFRGRITGIKRGINDDLWIATSRSGLIHFKNDKIIDSLKEENGLTSNICTALYIDSTLIWLGTNSGLNRIETAKDKVSITRFTSANGLGADFINAVVATDSNVYVGTTGGITIFNKKALTEKSVCILHILHVSENNKQLEKAGSYTFPYNAMNIQIDFTAISFKSAGDITYHYQLKGLNNNWNSTRANFINFSTLRPDNYTLLLKAVNKFGVESDTKSIQIIIQPPWWQTWPFRIAVLAAVGLLLLIAYRYNVRSIRRKEEVKREFEARFSALEQQALQAQMNPHFIFNSLNSMQTFILNLDVEGANNYLTNFASLIRQTLENSMQPMITVASELKYLKTYLSLEKLRFPDKFGYEVDVDDAIDQKNTLLPGMLLQPYIENSIRHGIQHRKDNNGLISVTINKTTDDSIVYSIQDNGVGRKKAEELRSSRHIEYQSRGTSINEKRIAAINRQFKTNIRVNTEDIFDENGLAAGTRVIVTIPRFTSNNL